MTRTYYQFLGIDEDADDDVIRAAYRECMLRIHPDLHPDDHDAQETAQRLNAASRTLLDENSRKTYDESLRRQRELDAAEIEAKVEKESGVKKETHSPQGKAGFKSSKATRPAFGSSPKTYRRAGAKRGAAQKRPRTEPALPQRISSFLLDKIAPLLVGLACSSVVIFILYCVITGKHPMDVIHGTETALSTSELIVDLGETAPELIPEGADDETHDEGDAVSPSPGDVAVGGDSFTAMEAEGIATDFQHDIVGGGSVTDVPSFPIGLSVDAVAGVGQQDRFDLSDDSPYRNGSRPAGQIVHQIPTPKEREEARQLVTSLFKDRYANAKSNSQKLALAREIYSVGLETHDDLAGMYELLRIAREMAINIGDIRLAEQVVDSIALRFEVDPLQARLTAFDAIKGNLIDRAAKEHLYFASLKLVDRFESNEAYDEATQACGIAVSCANSLRNARLTEGAKTRQEQLAETRREFRAVEKFVARQALDAADTEANYEVGKYLCFWKGQWDRGLPMLESSADPLLSEAAATDMRASGNEGALEAGEKWWAAADGLTGHESQQARARAVRFYLQARDTLDGLNRVKIEHRIGSVDVDAIAYMTKRMVGESNAGANDTTDLKSGFINSIGMSLIRIPSGQFQMGGLPGRPTRAADAAQGRGTAVVSQDDEQPRHTVSISQPFYMGVSEVTVGQFAAFVRATGYATESARDGRGGNGWDQATKALIQRPSFHWKTPGFGQTSTHPVVMVSWNDATVFCQWLSGQENKTYRLPTEAEWEYACRAGTQTHFQHADIAHDLERIANVLDSGAARALAGQKSSTSGDDGFSFTSPVGSFRPNRFGLFDMHGNVWEWCQDWYEPTYYARSPRVDPTGPLSGSQRILRGGAFLEGAGACRSAERSSRLASYRNAAIGFRVVMEAN